MGNLITGIHHVSLKCNGMENYQKTIEFYRDILGMPVVRTWGKDNDQGIMLDTGAGVMEISSNADDFRDEGAVRHFALATKDVDACVKACSDAGYKISMGPIDIDFGGATPACNARIAFCIGPVGEQVEFFDEK